MPTSSGSNKVNAIGKSVAGERRKSTASSSGIEGVGLIEIIIYLPTIDDQATLDAAAAAALAKIQASRSGDTSTLNMKYLMEQITLEVVDEYGTGAYKPEDQVTVTASRLGCSGLYKVKRIERDMTDPNYAKLDLTTRHTEYWELDEDVRRTVRNLNTLV
jgi:hypothetical protein